MKSGISNKKKKRKSKRSWSEFARETWLWTLKKDS